MVYGGSIFFYGERAGGITINVFIASIRRRG